MASIASNIRRDSSALILFCFNDYKNFIDEVTLAKRLRLAEQFQLFLSLFALLGWRKSM
jgi:hypothetical protein